MKTGERTFWRFKRDAPDAWKVGWPYPTGKGLYVMGYWNGDDQRGPVVDPDEIETRD